MDKNFVMLSKFAMITDYIDKILVNKNPLYSIFIHETLVRVILKPKVPQYKEATA